MNFFAQIISIEMVTAAVVDARMIGISTAQSSEIGSISAVVWRKKRAVLVTVKTMDAMTKLRIEQPMRETILKRREKNRQAQPELNAPNAELKEAKNLHSLSLKPTNPIRRTELKMEIRRFCRTNRLI